MLSCVRRSRALRELVERPQLKRVPSRQLHSSSRPKLVQKDGKTFREVALYVHWPYCKHICPYCDFNRFLMPNGPPGLQGPPSPSVIAQTHRSVHASMRTALLSELEMHLKAYGAQLTPEQWKCASPAPSLIVQPLITSIFFGGGTPSLADVRLCL